MKARRKIAKTAKTASKARRAVAKKKAPARKGKRGPAIPLPILRERLLSLYPDAYCELTHRNPFELLVATILSAQ